VLILDNNFIKGFEKVASSFAKGVGLTTLSGGILGGLLSHNLQGVVRGATKGAASGVIGQGILRAGKLATKKKLVKKAGITDVITATSKKAISGMSKGIKTAPAVKLKNIKGLGGMFGPQIINKV